MLYGTVTEFCTPTKVRYDGPCQRAGGESSCIIYLQCPIMNAGAKYDFYWEDGET